MTQVWQRNDIDDNVVWRQGEEIVAFWTVYDSKINEHYLIGEYVDENGPVERSRYYNVDVSEKVLKRLATDILTKNGKPLTIDLE